MKHKIVDMFYSIQGEGMHAGKAAFFIRFFGCNLTCDFGHGMVCDDKAHSDRDRMKKLTTAEVIDLIDTRAKHIVITGGEASMYNLNKFIEELQSVGYYVQVETNGYEIDNIVQADYITYSPKRAFCETAPDPKLTYHMDELKLLAGVHNPVDVEKWEKVRIKYIQPIGSEHAVDEVNTQYCIDFVKDNPDWRLSVQLHKYLGVE